MRWELAHSRAGEMQVRRGEMMGKREAGRIIFD